VLEEPAVRIHQNPLRVSTTRSSSVPHRKSYPLVVVALADDRLCRECATHLLAQGFAAPAVASAAEAAGLATCLSPDVVVFDLDARGGYAAGHLRCEPLTRHIGLVAVSPPELTGRIVPARGLFDAVIEAPCSPTALLTELLAMLRATTDAGARRATCSAGSIP
jgi:hypothetical protein